MPKEEQNWWHNQKVSMEEAKKVAEAKKNKKASKDDTAQKDKEIQDLRAAIAQLESKLEAGSGQAEPADPVEVLETGGQYLAGLKKVAEGMDKKESSSERKSTSSKKKKPGKNKSAKDAGNLLEMRDTE